MMTDNGNKAILDEILEDEVQLLGTVDPIHTKKRQRCARRTIWLILSFSALIGLGLLLFFSRPRVSDDVEGVFESTNERGNVTLLRDGTSEEHYAERIDTIINGHPLYFLIPHNASPHLYVGPLNEERQNAAILAFQAADIRADNHEILGDFVLSGEVLARGNSKKGYCAIINESILVGVADRTPLLASAISEGGYFFRQYPLVDQSQPVDNKPKGNAIRRALCEKDGQVFVVVSVNDESFPNFARLLVSLGVDNAIYLVGGRDALGWSVNIKGEKEVFGVKTGTRFSYRNESYILWE